jgi:inosine-uridine nucleoside N-ribohydrolase
VPDYGNEHDFNLQCDAEAARDVLAAADGARTTIVPIEVTAQTALRRSYLPALRAAGDLGKLLARQTEGRDRDEPMEGRFGQRYPALPADIVNFQHDPLACAVALGWPGVTIETLPLVVTLEDGWLHERVEAGGRPFRVVTAVDAAAFNQRWLDVVTGRA